MATAPDDDLSLLRAYEPVLRFTAGETFLPTSVENYLSLCTLWRVGTGDRRAVRVDTADGLTPQSLAEHGRRHVGDALSLRLVDEPMGRRETRRWRRDPSRHRFRPSARFAAVGLLGRLIDAVMRLSLVFRGRVPGGTAAAAGVRYLASPGSAAPTYYGRVTRSAGYVVLQYWFLYAMNDWRSSFTGVNDHEGDWEQVTLFLAQDAPRGSRPAWVAFSSHDEKGADLRRRHDDPDISWVGTHPVVYVGAGSHSGAYLPGEYLVTVQPPGVRRVREQGRRVLRAVAPWVPERSSSGLGIPFVDYRRGDGTSVGPQGELAWTAHLVDDRTPWVRDFRGLWGLDTSDPLGGERAPAGPRYERNGTLRHSWVDPVGWAALDAEPPTERAREEALRARLPELDAQIAQATRTVEEDRERLRRAAAGAAAVRQVTGVAPVPEREADAARAVADRLVALRRERDAVQEALAHGLDPGGPHAHLRHRAVPDLDPAKRPGTLVHAWSMVSVSVLLLGMAAVVLFDNLRWVTAGLALVVGTLLVEAAARRRLKAFLLTSSAVLVVVGPVVLVVVGFVVNWRAGVAGVLSLAAVALLVSNLRDFLDKR